jgi:hypothetical protein
MDLEQYERKREQEAAFEAFLDDRVSGAIDAFKKIIKDDSIVESVAGAVAYAYINEDEDAMIVFDSLRLSDYDAYALIGDYDMCESAWHDSHAPDEPEGPDEDYL